MTNLFLTAVLLLAGPGGYCQSSDAPTASNPAKKDPRRKHPSNGIYVEESSDWKGWLDKNFPDSSAAWPAEAANSFANFVNGSTWSFTSKGNFDRDGIPTALLLRLKSKPQKGYLIVDELAVKKWLGGQWTELLRISAADGITVNGVKPDALQSSRFKGYRLRLFAGVPEDPQNPGMWIKINGLDTEGNTLTETASFFYNPETRKYGGESY